MAKDKKALHDTYMRERRRIQQFIRRAKNRGYVFEDGIIPDIPKTITEGSIRRLQKLTPRELYEKSQFYSLEETTKETLPSGRVIEKMNLIPGLRGRGEERRRAVQKAQQTLGHKRAEREKRERQRILDEIYGKYNTPKEPTGNAITDYVIDDKEQPEEPSEYGTYSNAESDEGTEYESSYESVDYEEKDEEKEPDDDIFSVPEFDIEETNRVPDDFSYSTAGTFEYDEDEDEIKPTESSVSLDNLREMIENWEPSPNWTPGLTAAKEGDAKTARDILENAIDELGEEAIIENMKKHGDALQDLLESILYDSGSKEGNFKDGRTQVNANVQFFQSMLYDRPLTPDEAKSVSDIIEANHYAE